MLSTTCRRLAAALLSLLLVLGGPQGLAAAADGYLPPTETVTPPDTSGCEQKFSPSPAIDRSEDVAPGETTPAPLPVPEEPVGGPALGSCDFVLPAGAPALPSDISAHAWLVADLSTGQVIGGKDVHGRYRPASTLKLLTMLVVWHNLPDFSQTVIGTQEDADQEGSKVGVGEGGVYTVQQLLTGLMLNSGNDAAYALARANGGFDKTVADMNAAAAAIGALDTRAATVSGLDGPGQQTSVYDLALITRSALLQPGFTDLLSTETATFPGFGDRPAFGIATDNKLLTGYPGALGGKSGFTDDARNSYVGVAERDGHRLVVTMLGGSQHPRRQWMQVASMLDWGFAAVGAGLNPVGRLVDPSADLAAAASASAAASLAAESAAASSAASAAALTTAISPSSAAAASPAGAAGSGSASWWVWLLVVVSAVGAAIALRRQPGQHTGLTAGPTEPGSGPSIT